jgi:hypothetical protein
MIMNYEVSFRLAGGSSRRRQRPNVDPPPEPVTDRDLLPWS